MYFLIHARTLEIESFYRKSSLYLYVRNNKLMYDNNYFLFACWECNNERTLEFLNKLQFRKTRQKKFLLEKLYGFKPLIELDTDFLRMLKIKDKADKYNNNEVYFKILVLIDIEKDILDRTIVYNNRRHRLGRAVRTRHKF